jgi:hypothetical protein
MNAVQAKTSSDRATTGSPGAGHKARPDRGRQLPAGYRLRLKTPAHRRTRMAIRDGRPLQEARLTHVLNSPGSAAHRRVLPSAHMSTQFISGGS